MMILDLSPEALSDLENIRDYLITEFGETVSGNIIRKIMNDIRSLEVYPFAGHNISDEFGIDTDYMSFYSNKNYIFYRVDGNNIRIIRVLDERMDCMWTLFGRKSVEW